MRRARADTQLSGVVEPGKALGRETADGSIAFRGFSRPWASVERFDYTKSSDTAAAVRLAAALAPGIDIPWNPTLVARRGGVESRYSALSCAVEERSETGLLWLVSFDLPLRVVECRRTALALNTIDRPTLALPSAELDLSGAVVDLGTRQFTVGQARRYLLAVGTGLAVAVGSGAAAGVATADTTSATTPTASTGTTGTTGPTGPTGPSGTTAPAPADPTTPVTSAPATSTTQSTPPVTSAPAAAPATAPSASPVTSSTKRTTTVIKDVHSNAPTATKHKASLGTAVKISRPKTAASCTAAKDLQLTRLKRSAKKDKKSARELTAIKCVPAKPDKHRNSTAKQPRARHRSGGAALIAPKVIQPHVAKPIKPVTAPPASSVTSPTIWNTGAYIDPFTAAELQRFSTLVAQIDQPPRFLIPIYKAAGRRYHVQWEILAAINAIETNYGEDLAVSPKGAIGWMQFMPGTWEEYGIAAYGHHQPNPYDPRDAIFSAARYLAGNGAPRHIRTALFAYNHALWYVDAVLWRAQLITDRALGKRARNGYALPLDARYMRHLGRTDDGVDIEDAPNGAAVYSITPGIVTAVASDPTGFGPNYPVILVTRGPLAGQYIYYGHVAASLVHVGQRVAAGQPIAVMGHTGNAASLGHGHVEIGFSDGSGDPLNHHAGGLSAWTPSGDAMRHVLIALRTSFFSRQLRVANTHSRSIGQPVLPFALLTARLRPYLH